MKKILLTLLLFTNYSFSQSTAKWYTDIGSELSRIEIDANGHIWLMRPSSNTGNIDFQGCTLNQAKLIPPTEMQEVWLSMVLAAKFAKGKINIYGDCDAANRRVNATKLNIE